MDQFEQVNKFVINISKHKLTDDEVSILSKGLNFCPTPDAPDPGELRTDLDSLHRRLRLRYHFRDEEGSEWEPLPDYANTHSFTAFEHQKFKLPSTFNPTGSVALEAMILANEVDFNKRPIFAKHRENLTPGERIAINTLKNNKGIVIMPVDKGGAVLVQDREQYLQEGYKQLSNPKFYQKVDKELTADHLLEVNHFIDQMLDDGEIDISVYNYLFSKECGRPNLYLLPKIHKGIIPPPGRPILSANGCPTEKISAFVDHFLREVSTKHKSYVKDTTHFLQKLQTLGQLPPDSILVTFDVTSLYTNIPNQEGIAAAQHALNIGRPQFGLKPSNSSLVQLMEFVLTKNNFKFNGEHYLQIGGLSMGTRMAPNFADLYMAYFEQLYVYTYSYQPIIWVRFLDDCFCIFTHGQDKLQEFFTHINSCNSSIKFTMEASTKSVNFLDTTVSIVDNQIKTDLYSKPTDAHNYLLFSSAHPRSCKQSIPYSQFLRVRRICTDISDFDKHVINLGQHFLRRGYPLETIEQAVIKARRLDRPTLLAPKPANIITEPDDKVVLVTTYNPYDNSVRTISDKNWDILGKSTNSAFLHEKRLMTAYRRPTNLRDILVKADCQIKEPKKKPAAKQTLLTQFFLKGTAPQRATNSSSTSDLTTANPLQVRKTQSIGDLSKIRTPRKKCPYKKCRYCPLLDTSGTTISTTTGETFISKINVNCNSSNLIYSITCRVCDKQYVGQTKRRVLDRFQGHFYNIKSAQEFFASKNAGKPITGRAPKDAVGIHFSRSDHNGVHDLKIQVLEFMHLPPTSIRGKQLRLKIEKAWIHKLRCTAPHGLNIFD